MMATETYEITLPQRVVMPLARKAKSSRTTIPEMIIRIIEEHEGMIDDPFYRGENWRRVMESIRSLESGEPGVVKTMEELEAMANG